MAGIDKTYLKTWDQYLQVRNWCKTIGTITDEYGNTFNPIDYFWDEHTEESFSDCIQKQLEQVIKSHNEGNDDYLLQLGIITQEEYDNFNPMDHIDGIPIWNTPRFFDVFLIRNCPFDFIQERLKEQYGGGWSKTTFANHPESLYEQIKNKCSYYDTYKRNGRGKETKVNMDKFPIIYKEIGEVYLYVSVIFPDGSNGTYICDIDYWRHDDDLYDPYSAISWICELPSNIRRKTLFRKIRKWNLPKDSIVKGTVIAGKDFKYEFELKVK